MRCPKCGAVTEVTEKRGLYRNRRCLNPACRFDFTTCETFVIQEENRRVGAKALARRLEVPSSTPARRQKAASTV
jgi:hypothetical protein